jgi:hypothetical protein
LQELHVAAATPHYARQEYQMASIYGRTQGGTQVDFAADGQIAAYTHGLCAQSRKYCGAKCRRGLLAAFMTQRCAGGTRLLSQLLAVQVVVPGVSASGGIKPTQGNE